MAQTVILSLDMGGTTLSYGLVQPDGRVRLQRSVGTFARGHGAAVLEQLLEVTRTLLDAASRRRLRVSGIGIGVPGTVDVARGRIRDNIQNVPEFEGLALGPVLRRRFSLPVHLDNDVNALTLGEFYFGRARGVRNFAMLAAGTGVGGGIVIEGKLVRGRRGYGGEAGHTTVSVDGRPCFCGSIGCIKTYASGPDIAAQARERLQTARPSRLLELCGGDPQRLTAQEVFAAARESDPIALEVVEIAARALGAGVANLVNLLNPEMIILGGGVLEASDLLLPRIRRWAASYAFAEALRGTRLVVSRFIKRSSMSGAAALFLYETGRPPRSG
jgi:glucokinase